MRCVVPALLGCVLLASAAIAQPPLIVDLHEVSTSDGTLRRVLGSVGNGSYGVPVAGGSDCDGDGHADAAFAAMLASPLARTGAGEVFLVFGNGAIGATLDSAIAQPGILRFAGSGPAEAAGSELWMDDVTGDGLGDLLIARQNYSTAGRTGAGALSIVGGGAALRSAAASLQIVDLAAAPPGLTVLTLIGAHAFDRLGIWMRTGDVDGDGIADIVVGADQTANGAEKHAGAAFVIRGGAHLASAQTVDLADFGTTALAGHLARLDPPTGSAEHHLGATVQIADLDGNQRAEVLLATTLNRAGAALTAAGAPAGSADPVGGSLRGSVYILWDDNFPAGPWTAGLTFDLAALPGTRSLIHGGVRNISFGEELLGGLDYDGDGQADLFVGDLVADGTVNLSRPFSGSAHVLYDIAVAKGLTFDVDHLPIGLSMSTFLGAGAGDIVGDTAAQGDFDGDGLGDVAFSAPHGMPPGREEAGIIYVLFGRSGTWPALVDLRPQTLPEASALRLTLVHGARGRDGANLGDTLAYSGAAGDVDGDGRTDLITNEMLGDGATPAAIDSGNLLIIGGARLSGADRSPACPAAPRAGCQALGDGASRLALRRGSSDDRDALLWRWRGALGGVPFPDLRRADAAYSLCLYDASAQAQPRFDARESEGVACHSAACWRVERRRNRRRRGAALSRVRSRASAASLYFSAETAGAALPTLPLALPVVAQLLVGTPDGVVCWQASFASAELNTLRGFTAATP